MDTNSSAKSEKWENILKTVLRSRGHFNDLLTDDDLRIRIQFLCVFVIFFAVSAVMSIVNIITEWHTLLTFTIIFSVLSLINIILMMINGKTERLTRHLFAIEIIAMFTAFLINGEPEGFSASWIILLPACGMLLYRLRYGLIISGVQFVILIFLLWTGAGRSLLIYDYTSSFMLRFPLLYIASFMVGMFFEFIRSRTQEELTIARYNFEQLSKHDALTGLYNRLGFYAAVDEAAMEIFSKNGCAFALVDFDQFKSINDTYGHNSGDSVLRDCSAAIQSIVGSDGCVCRWGGDEISIYFLSKDKAEELCNRILDRIRALHFSDSGTDFKATVSIGLAVVSPGAECHLSDLINAADEVLYDAKDAGRDRLVVTEFNPA